MESVPPERPEALPAKLSRAEEARRIIEEYADELRRIMRELRRKMN